MASLAIQSLYDQKKREFFISGSSQQRFSLDFLDAVNRAIRRINIRANLATALSTVDDMTDSITVDNEAFEYVLSDLTTDELVRMGQRTAKGVVLKSLAELNEGIDLVRQNILHVRQDADTDDDTYNNVGLGALDA